MDIKVYILSHHNQWVTIQIFTLNNLNILEFCLIHTLL
jgi:hypothetical protein